MRSFLCKAAFWVFALPSCLLAGPAGPPAGQSILNSPVYQRNSQAWIDTMTVQGILQLPYGTSTPPANQCTVSSQTGRVFIVSSTTVGGARIWICEGTNGWQVKNSTGGGGAGIPGGLNTQFQYNNGGSFAGSANLTTDGSTITATRFSASTVTISNFTTFLSVSSTTWQSVSTITFNDGMVIDMSGINDSNLGEGLLIPTAFDNCVNATRNGSLCWDTTNKILYVGNGAGLTNATSIGLKTLNGGVTVSSPTMTLNFDKNQFIVTAPVISTASITINPSSVTLLGNGNLSFQGRVTNSNQPTFGAYKSANSLNVTGDGTNITVPFDTEEFDNSSNYSASTFTAPVAGRYDFYVNVTIRDVTSGNKCELILVNSAGNSWTQELWPTSNVDLSISKIMNLSANDKVWVDLNCSGGAKVVDIIGSGGSTTGRGFPTFFSGGLRN